MAPVGDVAPCPLRFDACCQDPVSIDMRSNR
jgi:hypothetical protein